MPRDLPSLPRPLRTRRAFLSDLGRTTFAVAVLGPVLAACGTEASTSSGEASSPSPAGGSAAPTSAGSGTGDLTWERASFGFVSAYILVRGGEAAIFDTGTGDDGIEPIEMALTAAGVSWDDVAHVILSHRHGDHAGGLSLVNDMATNATLYAANPDFDAVRDRVDTSAEVSGGDQVMGLDIIATPGHTDGHISAHDPDAGLLLTGDAMVNRVRVGGTSGDGVAGSPPDFTADAAAAVASVKTLAGLSFDTALFGHGDPLTSDAQAEFQTYADTL